MHSANFLSASRKSKFLHASFLCIKGHEDKNLKIKTGKSHTHSLVTLLSSRHLCSPFFSAKRELPVRISLQKVTLWKFFINSFSIRHFPGIDTYVCDTFRTFRVCPPLVLSVMWATVTSDMPLAPVSPHCVRPLRHVCPRDGADGSSGVGERRRIHRDVWDDIRRMDRHRQIVCLMPLDPLVLCMSRGRLTRGAKGEWVIGKIFSTSVATFWRKMESADNLSRQSSVTTL